MLVLNVSCSVFTEKHTDNSSVFFCKTDNWVVDKTVSVYTLVVAKLVGKSLVLTKCECYSNEYTDSLLLVNQRETEDDAIYSAVSGV